MRHPLLDAWRRYRDFHWLVVVTVGAFAAILGCWGVAKSVGAHSSAGAIVYKTLQLFWLNYDGAEQSQPIWQLDVARWLAAIFFVVAASEALFIIFHNQFGRFALRAFNRHVVIFGLERKGYILARAFCVDQHTWAPDGVIVIADRSNTDFVSAVTDSGAVVVTGEPRDPELLRLAGVQRAKYLIAIGSDNDLNRQVADLAAKNAGAHSCTRLECYAHIENATVLSVFRHSQRLYDPRRPVRIHYFNIYEAGAVALLTAQPPLTESALVAGKAPHLLVIGLGQLGESLISFASRWWWIHFKRTGLRLHVSVIDRMARSKCAVLMATCPWVELFSNVNPIEMEIESDAFLRGQFLAQQDALSAPDASYVCVNDDPLAILASQTLCRFLGDTKVRILTRITSSQVRETLVAACLDRTTGECKLDTFTSFEEACDPALIIKGDWEMLARILHMYYVLHRVETGHTLGSGKIVGWNELDPETQDSNRQQAQHTDTKLEAVACVRVPMTTWYEREFEFTANEIETLARIEHERWVEEKASKGWRYGEVRDDTDKVHPSIRAWDDLDELTRDIDRDFVRKIPAYLATIGYMVARKICA